MSPDFGGVPLIASEKQVLLDRLATAARKTADNCGAAARLHAAGEMIAGSQIAIMREQIAEQLNALHDLLPENTEQ